MFYKVLKSQIELMISVKKLSTLYIQRTKYIDSHTVLSTIIHL